MCLKKIRIPREDTNEVLTTLGTLNNAIEFVDLNTDDPESKKNYISLQNDVII
jgi:hypothetical protein